MRIIPSQYVDNEEPVVACSLVKRTLLILILILILIKHDVIFIQSFSLHVHVHVICNEFVGSEFLGRTVCAYAWPKAGTAVVTNRK